jgi:hypothetical protein
MNSPKEVLRTEPITDPKIVADLPATFESTNAPWSTDGLSSATRAIKAYNQTLLAAGYTDEQIVGIVNTAIKECGGDLTVDNFFDRPVAALQAEVDRLNRRETSGPRGDISAVPARPLKSTG